MSVALELFLAFLKIGALSFGGAYSFLPLIEREVVTNHGWMARDEFLDILGMVQVFPGAISIKFATYVGFKELGVLGAVIANVANFLPPAILILALTTAYRKFGETPAVRGSLDAVRFAALGLIAALVYQFLSRSSLNASGAVIAIAAFACVAVFRVHPAYVILGALVIGMCLAALPAG